MIIVSLAIIPALGLILYTAAEQRRLSAADAQAEALWLARLVAADQERLINETRQLLLTLAQLSEVRGDDQIACSPLFAELLEQYPQYTNLGVAAPDGEVICSAIQVSSLVRVSERADFMHALQERAFAIGEYQVDNIIGNPAINFSYPVVDEDREVQAVVFATLNPNWLSQLVTSSQVPEGSALLMVDRNSVILMHYPDAEKWVGQSAAGSELVQKILSRGVGQEALPGLDGVARLYAFTPLRGVAGARFYVGYGIAEEVAYAQANELLARNLTALSVVLVFALVATWVGGDLFFLRRVKSLLFATQRLAAGDLSARTGLPYGQGELSELSRAFDRMSESMEKREDERKRAEKEIIRHNRNLAALNTVTATVSSSLELPEILESLKNLLAEQLNVPGGIIYFYDDPNNSLTIITAWGVPAAILSETKKMSASDLHYEQVIKCQESFLNPDLNQVRPYALLGLDIARPKWRSYICVPLVAKGEVQGVLDLFSQAHEEFTKDQVSLFTALGQQVGVAIHNARLFEEVRAGRRRLQVLSKQLLEIQESERRHIARELHDEIGQALTAVKVNLQATQRVTKDNILEPYLGESISIVERTLQQVRNLSLDLRPSLLDDLGVVVALRWYVDRQAQRAGFNAQFSTEISADMRLPTEVETTCFRVVQEALTNIVRHAQAQHVEVELRQDEKELELLIRDDGIGFDINAVMERAAGDLSLGLLGMQERVQLIGGSIEISSSLTQGTEIRAYFPLDPKQFYLESEIRDGGI